MLDIKQQIFREQAKSRDLAGAISTVQSLRSAALKATALVGIAQGLLDSLKVESKNGTH